MTHAEQTYLYESVGDQIRQLRKRAGLNQEELAKKLNKSRVSIVNIEKGRQHPSLHLLIDLSKIFNVTLDDFIPTSNLGAKNESRKLKSKVNRAVRHTSKASGEKIDSEKIVAFIKKGITTDKP